MKAEGGQASGGTSALTWTRGLAIPSSPVSHYLRRNVENRP